MRDWNLKLTDPLSLTLASDARLGPTDYLNDHIWELSLKGGTPPAVTLQTTFGLRARAYRLFPIFYEGDIERSDPNEFTREPIFQRLFPNYIALNFSPLPDIDVAAEYWVPDSHSIASRFKLTNRSKIPRKLKVDWICQLSPTEGERMAPTELQAATILAGKTTDLSLVFFLTGGPTAGTGSYPSLTLDLELNPDVPYEMTWAHAALSNTEEAFKKVRSIASQNWDAENTRNEMINAGQIEIYTGDSDWDAALMLTQKTALGLFIGSNNQLPFPSLVQNRQPDQGYSLRGDGSDYSHLWNGQSPLEAYFLADIILPIAPELAEGLLRNYLAVQASDGSIDWKPGLSGQRSRVNATPILASLAWRIYEATENIEFLKEVYHPLVKFLLSWFTPQHDRDGDGIPEWDNVLQSGFEDHPIYSHWHDWSLGLEISTAESPALCASLYRECRTLLNIAQVLSLDEHISTLTFLSMRLKVTVDAAWDNKENSYPHWDRDTHISARCELVGQCAGSGAIQVDKTYKHPARLLFHLQTSQDTRPHPHITVVGIDLSGNTVTQNIPEEKFKWNLKYGRMTGELIFRVVVRIEVSGLEDSDMLTVYWAGHSYVDYSSLLPIWARLTTTENAQLLVEKTILSENRFWRTFGLPACANPPDHSDNSACTGIYPGTI